MDREKVVSTFEKIISVCKEDGCDFVDLTFEDAEQILALLKEQETHKFFVDESGKITPLPIVVRCRDCKYWSAERINDFNKCRRWINVGVKNFATIGDWFCADGERKSD